MPAVFLPARMPLTRALVCVAVLLLVEGRGFGSPPPAGGDNNRLYERTGLEEDSPGRSCGELMSMGMTDSGVYWLLPDGYVEPFQAYCDQKSFGGGWQMCYSAKTAQVHMTNESALVYDEAKPYKTDGYVSNCKHVPFNELLFVAHAEERCVDKNMKRCRTFDRSSSEDEKAWFTYEATVGESNVHFTVAGNSGRNLVAPAIQLQYSELMELQRRFEVHQPDRTDSTGREAFGGSVATGDQTGGLWEIPARIDTSKRASDYWKGRGVAYKVSDAGVVSPTDNWKYEVVVCDEASEYGFGFFVSGIEGNSRGCFKTCNEWCGDTLTDHYRADAGDKFCNQTARQRQRQRQRQTDRQRERERERESPCFSR
ncbi:hypothetical protein T484DRAFT_2664995 [Baffinella frigidus]|nr:hypothetical protein T484DRAFT_2664995 [Cryptophyta sp. CCMP2293]